MSRSAAYCVLIRDGKQRWFADVWGNLKRELVWGPDEFEAWLTAGEEIDEDPEDVSGVAIVNFDTKTLTWGEQDVLFPPKVHALHHKLLEHSWAGFSIIDLPHSQLYSALDALREGEESVDAEEDVDLYDVRPRTLIDAAGEVYPDCKSDADEAAEEEEYEEDEWDPPLSEDNPGAWLTIVDEQGTVHQRGLSAVPIDLLSENESAVHEAIKLEPLDTPEEKFVTEGLWIHLGERRISFWGTEGATLAAQIQSGWPRWKVEFCERGYAQQCELSGLEGRPMSDEEALGLLLPQVLSNKRLTMANLLGAVGGSLKKTAIKATGCLTMMLSLPIVLVGLYMNKWKETGYALITLIIIVVAIFKVIEYRLKSKFRNSGLAERDEALEEQRPPVAGPLDETIRKQRVAKMLSACGLPAIEQIEPHFENLDGIL